MMNSEELISAANSVLFSSINRYLSDVETIILLGAIANQTYEKIALDAGYSVGYIKRDVGPKLWRNLSQALDVKVSKNTFQAALEQYAATHTSQSILPKTSPASTMPMVIFDRGEMPSPPLLVGRDDELTQLRSVMLAAEETSLARMIAIVGIGGVGKTALAAAMMPQLQAHFQIIIWRSLQNAPPLAELLEMLVKIVSQNQATRGDGLTLLEYLRTYRCLIVLDNLETLLNPHNLGRFLPEYADYGTLLEIIAEAEHQSCVLLTSREKPAMIATLTEKSENVHAFQLTGLNPQVAHPLIKSLTGNTAVKTQLIQSYGGNPLALKIVAASIQELFEGNINTFLDCGITLFNGVRRLLDEQFNRIGVLEESIMYWLAINRDWTSVDQLQADIIPVVGMDAILEALEQLSWRNLVLRQQGTYTQQPVVMEYVTLRLINTLESELLSCNLDFFCRYALFKTTLKDYIGQTQVRLLIQPVAEILKRTFPTMVALQTQMRSLLEAIRHQTGGTSDYATGNLLNLCHSFSLDLTGWDCSNLSVWHGNFRNNSLQGVNLSGADLARCQFTDYCGALISASFNRDGTLLANGDTQGIIYLRRVDTGQVIHILQGHHSWIRELSFSPDNRVLASSSHDRTLKLWDVNSGLCLRTLEGHEEVMSTVAWSPDNSRLLSSSFDRTIKIWNPQSGECISTFQTEIHEITCSDWSRDGKHFLVCGAQALEIRDSQTGQIIQQFEGHQAQVVFAHQNSKGDRIATTSQDATIKIWDTSTGQCLQTLSGPFPPSYCVIFHPNDEMIASGHLDGIVRLWDWQSGRCVRLLTGHHSLIWRNRFSPDGQYLASASDDCSLKLWDVATGDCLRTWKGYVGAVWSLAVKPQTQRTQSSLLAQPDTLIAAGIQEGNIDLWDYSAQRYVNGFEGHRNLIWSLAWQPQGALLASASGDGMIMIWNLQSGRSIRTIDDHQSIVSSVAWHPDGQSLASISVNGIAKIHSIHSGECQYTLRHDCYLYSVAFHPNGTAIATGGQNGKIYLWDVNTEACVSTLSGHENSIWSLAWNQSGTQLASCAHDGTVRLWDLNTCLHIFDANADWVWAIAWSPDETRLACGTQAGTVLIWDVTTKECIQVLRTDKSWVRAIAWLPDGHTIVAGCGDGMIHRWDIHTGDCQATVRAKRPYEGTHISNVTGISPAQRSSLIALGAIDTGET